jgi:CheY-like chemotaxis protein
MLGFETEAACDGWDAMRAVTLAARAGDPIALVLVDRHMPGMSGLQCVRALQQDDASPPILLMTLIGPEDLQTQLAAEGLAVAGVLAKPVTPSSLLEAASAALGQPLTVARGRQRVDALDGRREQLRGLRLLLVEDNAINQELAIELLGEAGISVVTAGDGREAIEQLERHAVEGVLMDCQMPSMDGYEATREIRRNPRWRDLPIIAMTANAMSGDRDKALAAGMNDHIAKPIDVRAMFETLNRWLRPAGGPG